jgi:hypothetical protein
LKPAIELRHHKPEYAVFAALRSVADTVPVLAFVAPRLFVGSNGETAWSIIPDISSGTN